MVRRGLPALLAAALLLGAASEPPPRLARGADGRLWLRGLPPLLGREPLARQLESGLTTVLALTVEAEEGVIGGAEIRIRYELWDEVFRVAVATPAAADSEPEGRELESADALDRWWRALRLAVGDAPAVGSEVRVTLAAVPFSRSEQLDTQRWLAESARRAERGQAGDPGTPLAEGDAVERVLTTLIATSIRRRPLTVHRWRVVVRAEEPERPRREDAP